MNKNKKLPFQVKLVDVTAIHPRAGFEKGQICDVYEETREGYRVWSNNYGMTVEVYFNECEKIIPEIEDNRKEKDESKRSS